MESKETFADFIARRTQELDADEVVLRRRLREIEIEREHLRNALKVSFGINTPESEVARAIRKRTSGIKPGTIMDDVIKILSLKSGGMTSHEILETININRQGDWIKRESLSPQLSRLRQAGFIELVGSYWRLPVGHDDLDKEAE
jgi:hypothetical protein